MAKEIVRLVYVCPYCNEQYDDESDAEDCRDDCADIETIEEQSLVDYQCDYCGKVFKAEDEDDNKPEELCNECEANHMKKMDKYFDGYKLKIARSHKHQKSLGDYDAKRVLRNV